MPNNWSPNWLIAAIVAATLATACSTGPAEPEEQPVDETAQHLTAEDSNLKDSELVPVDDSALMGNPDAPVTIVEFTSMQCPFCGRAAHTIDELVERYPDEVRVVFKHFPLPNQQQAMPASKVLVATQKQNEALFWDMKHALFEHLNYYGQVPMEELGAELADELGMDVEQFREDFNDPETEEIIAEDVAMGQGLGVRGTPHFFVNGEVVNGAQPIDEFVDVVEDQLELVDELTDDGVAEDEIYSATVEHNMKR